MYRIIPEKALKEFLGYPVKNYKGQMIGSLVEIIPKNNHKFSYLIIKSSSLEKYTRFYAVPASTVFLKILHHSLTLMIEKDELQLAKGIAANKLSQTNLKFSSKVFEIYQYQTVGI